MLWEEKDLDELAGTGVPGKKNALVLIANITLDYKLPLYIARCMNELKNRAIFNHFYMVDKIGREDAENMFKNTIQPIIKVSYDGKMGDGNGFTHALS